MDNTNTKVNIKYIINNNIIYIIKTKHKRNKSVINVEKMSITYFRRNTYEKTYLEKPKKIIKQKNSKKNIENDEDMNDMRDDNINEDIDIKMKNEENNMNDDNIEDDNTNKMRNKKKIEKQKKI